MHDAGYDISLYQHIDTAENRRDFFTTLPVRRNVDAVFVASFAVDAEEIGQLKRTHVPIIGINTPTRRASTRRSASTTRTGCSRRRSI